MSSRRSGPDASTKKHVLALALDSKHPAIVVRCSKLTGVGCLLHGLEGSVCLSSWR